MRISKTYNGLTIPDTITKKKKVTVQIESPDGETTQGVTKSGTVLLTW